MRADKIKNAELLFDAIGCIDDRLIQEAQVPPASAAQPKRTNFAAIIALAATLSLTVMILSTILIAKVVGGIKKDSVPDDSGISSDVETSASLDHVLINCAPDAVVVDDAEDIDFFDGNAKIIWQIDGESSYRMVTLTSKYDASALKKRLEQADQSTPADTENTQCDIWITFGDGKVVSPHLKKSAGNIGYAELFDYSPEIVPDEHLTALINDLISD